MTCRVIHACMHVCIPQRHEAFSHGVSCKPCVYACMYASIYVFLFPVVECGFVRKLIWFATARTCMYVCLLVFPVAECGFVRRSRWFATARTYRTVTSKTSWMCSMSFRYALHV
jgi:hypothetical protein